MVRLFAIYQVNMPLFRNQLRYRGNLVKQIKKDEKRYYEELVDYSRRNLMLFPYHLSDVVVKVGPKNCHPIITSIQNRPFAGSQDHSLPVLHHGAREYHGPGEELRLPSQLHSRGLPQVSTFIGQ